MKPPKIVIIGAGSLFFGRQAIWAAANLPGFRGCTLSLVDIEAQRLDKITRLAHLAAGPTGARIESTTEYRTALKGADYVVLSFRGTIRTTGASSVKSAPNMAFAPARETRSAQPAFSMP